MNELKKRARKAARRYLELKGMEIVDKNWSRDDLAGRIDIIADDDGTIVFATVSVSSTAADDAGFREEPLSREQAELLAATWLGEHPDTAVDVPVRFDRIAILAVSGDRAMLRHHVNCLGLPEVAC